jgi:hypothetical protein
VFLGVLALAGVIGAALVLRASDPGGGADGEAGSASVPPMTAPPAGPGPGATVGPDRISVVASSFLPPDGSITYEPANTIDDDLQTAWNSDTPDDDGRGQTLTYRFTEPVTITSIRFVNGYAKNDDVYGANHRIQDLVVHTDGGSRLVTLLDTPDHQEIAFEFGYTSKVTLEVQEIYPGDGFADTSLSADLALTEVEFVATPR